MEAQNAPASYKLPVPQFMFLLQFLLILHSTATKCITKTSSVIVQFCTFSQLSGSRVLETL